MYTTFKRSCLNFHDLAHAPITVVERGLTITEARERCKEFNDNLTPAQERKGTKLEFTSKSL